jgi:hypothetical protein
MLGQAANLQTAKIVFALCFIVTGTRGTQRQPRQRHTEIAHIQHRKSAIGTRRQRMHRPARHPAQPLRAKAAVAIE